jgi:hypothetical protein
MYSEEKIQESISGAHQRSMAFTLVVHLEELLTETDRCGKNDPKI